MSVEKFEKSCDYVSQMVDARAFEDMQWNNGDGKQLEKFIEIMTILFGGRQDLNITRLPNSSREVVAFLLRVWSNPVARINVRINRNEIIAWPSTIDEEPVILNERPASVEKDKLSSDSVALVISDVMSKIRV